MVEASPLLQSSRTPRPGPGKGWRSSASLGIPRSSPSSLTSVLYSSTSGSITFPCPIIFSMAGTRLWCVFIVSARFVPPLSIVSGYIVPCPSKCSSMPIFSA